MATFSFQTHVNGMRAIAILGVVLYHLNNAYCPAGYFGVDIFLVISGYFLFLSLAEPRPGKPPFRYGQYLNRKMWRIFPSMLLVAGVTCAVQTVVLDWELPKDAILTAVASCFGWADFYIDSKGGYFDTSSQYNPLLHFWYLGITLQLYLLAPLLLVPMAKGRSRAVMSGVVLIVGVVSLVFHALISWSCIPWEFRQSLLEILGMHSAYYHLFPRAWEVLAACCIPFLPALDSHVRLRSALAWGGLLACLSPFFLFDKGSPCAYPAVLGAILLIRYGADGLVGRLLGCKVLQWVGTISFSLYLWHWPIMALWKYILIYEPSPAAEVGMVLLSGLAAYVAWRWVERFRMEKWDSGIPALKALLSYGLLLLPPCSLAVYVGYMVHQASVWRALNPVCPPLVRQGFSEDVFPREPAPLGEDTTLQPVFLLLGDSHAFHLREGLVQACTQAGMMGSFFNNSCTPYWNYHLPLYIQGDACWNRKWADGLMEYLRVQDGIRYVLIAQHWVRRLTCDAGLDGRNMKALMPGERLAFTSAGLRETCDQIKALGKKVVLLADTPMFACPAPVDEAKRCKRFGWKVPERCVDAEQHRRANAVPDKLMKELLAEGRVAAVIDLSAPLLQGSTFPAAKNGVFLFSDTNHLSPEGSRIVGEYVIRELRNLDAELNKDSCSTP